MHLAQQHDDDGRTPLAYAMLSKGRGALVQWLQENTSGADVTPFRPTMTRPNIHLPDAYNRVLEQVETQGWQTVQWKDSFTMLHWAAGKGHVELCEYLLKLNADLHAMDSQGRLPMDCAEQNKRSDVVAFFKELEDSPNKVVMNMTAGLPQRPVGRQRNRTTIPESAMSTMQFSALGSSSSIGSEGDNASKKRAVPEAYVKVMEQIDKIGWDKMQWARGFTLLHWAGKNDRPDLVARFMRQGAKADAKDATGRSAMDYAQEHGSHEAMKVLVSGPPVTEEPQLLGTLIDRNPRMSMAVIGTPMT